MCSCMCAMLIWHVMLHTHTKCMPLDVLTINFQEWKGHESDAHDIKHTNTHTHNTQTQSHIRHTHSHIHTFSHTHANTSTRINTYTQDMSAYHSANGERRRQHKHIVAPPDVWSQQLLANFQETNAIGCKFGGGSSYHWPLRPHSAARAIADR